MQTSFAPAKATLNNHHQPHYAQVGCGDDDHAAKSTSRLLSGQNDELKQTNKPQTGRQQQQQADQRGGRTRRARNSSPSFARPQHQLKLSHHVICEPISQLNDLKLNCANENQFIVILEAYYSDLYPEFVCQRAASEAKLHKLTGTQLVSIFRQLYSTTKTTTTAGSESRPKDLIKLNPTLSYGHQRPFCLDDLKQSFQAKCSGRSRCKFNRSTDHQFPGCANLKPGHVFARYLCIDDTLLVRYCNANALLASHSSVLNRVKRHQSDLSAINGRIDDNDDEDSLDTPDFGFIASPGYPNFYATPTSGSPSSGVVLPPGSDQPDGTDANRARRQGHQVSECGWTVEAELGQRITVKLLDASLAPHKQHLQQAHDDYSTNSFPQYETNDNRLLSLSHSGRSVVAGGADELLMASSSVNVANGNSPTDINGADSSSSTTDTKSGSNVYFESTNTTTPFASTKRIVFKIDQYDYEVLKLNLANKLHLAAAQCQGYDRVVLRDSADGEDESSAPSTSVKSLEGDNTNSLAMDPKGQPTGDSSGARQNNELELISKLPITLYKNHLIDFNNQTIYHNINSASQQQSKQMPRIDYQALLDSLNPLQLTWFYQQNVTLCSSGQLDHLSSPVQKNKISFTSTSNTIHLDLVSGRMFNPLNRGVLIWYHKHGCPFTRTIPTRSRLVFRNETTEIFHCLPGFVFSDTRQPMRIRRCSLEDQIWHDATTSDVRHDQIVPIPSCVYIEDLPGDSHFNSIKFDQLVAGSASTSAGQQSSGILSRLMPNSAGSHRVSSQDVAVELVGVPTPAGGHQLNDDVDLLSNYLLDQGRHHGSSEHNNKQANLSDLWRQLVDYIIQTDDPNDTSPKTHQQLVKDSNRPTLHDPNGLNSTSVWSRTGSAIFSRRFLVPALAILVLFFALNLVIYVIFLVAIPGLARCLCGRSKRNGKHGALSSKVSHYESDYSVTMGMSL